MRTTSAFGQTRPRILVIDDNADAALTLSMLLKLKGYDVQSRHSGREGIQAAEAWRPGVIVCDISMPEMDGYQTARLIREQPWGSAVYLVALTGYSQAEDKERALEAGFDAHLVKPVDLEALLGLLM
jgi:CheY-like chemotaxis protein